MKKLNDRSIRKRLLLWLLIPLSLLWVVGAVVTYLMAESYAEDLYDAQLLNSADSVIGRLRLHENGVDADLPPAAVALLKNNFKDKMYFQVIRSNGTLIDGDKDLPMPPRLPDIFNVPVFDYSVANGARVRTVLVEAFVEEAPAKHAYVYLAETLDSRQALARHILVNTAISGLLVILCGVGFVWFGVSRGLLQLEQLQRAVSSRSQSDLRPLDENDAPLEVRPLVHSINDLLGVVREDVESKQRFVANAAHQLRTPLAGLKTYIGILRKLVSDEHACEVLVQLDAGADRTTHLVNRLLALAKAEPSADEESRHKPVDLNSVASASASNLVIEAVGKNIDLSFEASERPAWVWGDESSLLELITNLVENAVRYTPKGGAVVVSIFNDQGVRLCVDDNGPGIPPEERERVFERFYRILGTDVTGSGLGLAIVSEIARSHHARVLIEQGPNKKGTRVMVEFLNSQSGNEFLTAPRAEAAND